MTPRARGMRGFSLTELLVAMVIGLLLMGGLITLVVNSKKNYAQQDYNARLQENARFAMEFLAYDARMAGYYGCSNNIINDDTVTPVTATDGGGASPDAVTVTYGEPYDAGDEVVLDADSYDPYGAPLTLALNQVPSDWSEGDTLVIADCGSAAVADIASGGIDANNNQVTVTASAGLGRVFDPASDDSGPVTVRRLVTYAYAVQATGQSGIPVLTRNNNELVEGIENLQLLYQSIAGDTFSDGSSSTTNPTAVQLGALVRSVSHENLSDREYGSGTDLTMDDGQHTLLNVDVSSVTPSLRGQRRVFSNTLAVRNRSQ